MADVFSLRGTPIPLPGEAEPNVVAKLRELLEQAEAGQITGLTGVLNWPDDSTSSFSVGQRNRATIGALLCQLSSQLSSLADTANNG